MTDDFEFDEETKCIYEILKFENNTTSRRVLELASEEFLEICTGCASGDAFLRAVKKLEKHGIVKSNLGKGGYRWQLLRNDL
jgi:hypothetical protein